MKLLYFLFIIILASIYAADDERPKYCSDWSGKDAPSQPSDCYNLWINESSIKNYYFRCCYENRKYYFGGEYENKTRCRPITKEYYDTIVSREKSGLNYYKTLGGVIDNYEFNCSSNYLYISLLSLIIFLL